MSDNGRFNCRRDILGCEHYDSDDKTTYRVVKSRL